MEITFFFVSFALESFILLLPFDLTVNYCILYGRIMPIRIISLQEDNKEVKRKMGVAGNDQSDFPKIFNELECSD